MPARAVPARPSRSGVTGVGPASRHLERPTVGVSIATSAVNLGIISNTVDLASDKA